MLETLFGIRYTGSVDGNVYGYTVARNGEGTYEATVVRITPTGDKPLGTYTVPVFGHGNAIRSNVARDLYT